MGQESGSACIQDALYSLAAAMQRHATATLEATGTQYAYLSLGGISGCSGGRGLIGSSCGTGGLGRVLPGGSNSGGGEPIPGTGSCRKKTKSQACMQAWLPLASSIEQGIAPKFVLHTWGGLYSGGRLGWLGLPSSGRPHSGGDSMTPVVSGLPDADSVSSSSWYICISSSARNSSAAWCSLGYSLLGPGG